MRASTVLLGRESWASVLHRDGMLRVCQPSFVRGDPSAVGPGAGRSGQPDDVACTIAPMDLARPDLALVRRLWGLGISSVLILVIVPYPVMAIVGGDDQVHRVHDTAGAVHYLLWWGVPVLLWSLRRSDPGLWLLGLASGVAIAAAAMPTGDLFVSGSWAPLVLMLPLVPSAAEWRRGPASAETREAASRATPGWRLEIGLVPVTVVLAAMAWRLVPTLLDAQRLGATDIHGTRYHYGGMAAAHLAAALVTGIAVVRSSVVVRGLVASGLVLIGTPCLVWPDSASSLSAAEAWVDITCGAVVALAAVYDARRDRHLA